jgi:hypothetical protein
MQIVDKSSVTRFETVTEQAAGLLKGSLLCISSVARFKTVTEAVTGLARLSRLL